MMYKQQAKFLIHVHLTLSIFPESFQSSVSAYTSLLSHSKIMYRFLINQDTTKILKAAQKITYLGVKDFQLIFSIATMEGKKLNNVLNSSGKNNCQNTA